MGKQNSSEKLTVGIGIDFGTSNSAAAIFNGETVTMISSVSYTHLRAHET